MALGWLERDPFLLTLTPGYDSFIVLTEASGLAVTVLPEPVPEPTTLALWGVTAAGLGFLARRRRNRESTAWRA